ncbi:MAG TPA: peroxiredoxin [Bryobacteraceae bacterium]|nr:peroxiredoxin [Bryobacteraceae bacterium]
MLSWLFSDPLPVGSAAPAFTLPDDSGKTVTLEGLRGNNVVLVWYPGDDTTICRAQLCELRDRWSEARARGVAVFGVNPQGRESHRKFRAKFSFPFPLLIDKGQKVGELYQTRGLIVKRTVYLIGRNGLIRYAKRGKPSVDEVLAHAEP